MLQITLIEEEDKYEKIQNVNPNVIQNRPDLLGELHFQLLCLKHKPDGREVYIPFKIEGGVCPLYNYMMDIEKSLLDAAMAFLTKKFKVFRFSLWTFRNIYPKMHKKIEWVLDLPNSYDEYLAQFSRKASYNRRREIRILNNDYHCEIKYFSREEIPLDLVHEVIKKKLAKYGAQNNYILTNTWALLMFFSITDCWVMELNGKVAAGVFYTTVPNSSETLLVTTFYEPEYEKYCIGIITLYHSIKELINKKITRIHMGRNDVDYKKNARCTGHELYVGFITPNPILYLVHKIRRKLMKFMKNILNAS